MTPTARSLALFRDEGWHPCVVEKWHPVLKHLRIDAYGAYDILAYLPKETLGGLRGNMGRDNPALAHPLTGGIALVQCTSTANLASREAKVRDNPHTWGWLAAGGLVFVIGWAKRGPQGRRKLWSPTIKQVTL